MAARPANGRAERVARRFEVPMLVAALLVIPVIAVEESGLDEPWDTIAGVTNWAIWIAFATELVVMLWVVPSRWAWLRSHPLEVAIVLLTPPFMPGLLQGLRGARLLRLLRLMPVLLSARLARRVFSLDGFRYAALLAVLAVVGGGAAFAAVENGHHEEPVSAWDGFWWAMTTATTVGYGDIFPVTNGGRLIAMGLMIVGIGFLGFLTAAVAQRFILPVVEEDIEKVSTEVEVEERELLRQLSSIQDRLAKIEQALAKPEQRE
ncbi:MAG: voltage-gated potassium channel [Miltoncostaeaceae bacterium]|nr:voltage-gated potassium channel [Miltoncostaeaceae bacterium]